MARYTGPTSKIARKFGEPIFGYDRVLEKKSYGPGQHGPSKRRRNKSEYGIQLKEKQKAKHTYGLLEKQFSNLFKEAAKRRRNKSEYGIQLKEKQKAKHTYGLLEKQFSNLFKEAAKRTGVTGEILFQLLEARLDNTVFRLGIASTRRAARQFVSHKHITVNGKLVNIPSYTLRPGDVVGVRERSKSMSAIQDSLSKATHKFSWLIWEGDKMEGKLANLPTREEIPENVNEQLIVELYSK